MADRRYLLAVIVRDAAWASALASSGVVGVKWAWEDTGVPPPPGIPWPVAFAWLGLSALLLIPAHQLPRATLLGHPSLAVRTARLYKAMLSAGAKPSRIDFPTLMKAVPVGVAAMASLLGAFIVSAPWLRWSLAAAYLALLHAFLWLARGTGEKALAASRAAPTEAAGLRHA